MKVKPKQLLFSSLPKAKAGKKMKKAQMGKRMGETGAPPITLNSMPDDYFKKLENMLQPPQQPPMNAFDNIKGITPFQPTGDMTSTATWDPMGGPAPKKPVTQPQQPAASLRKKGLNPGQATLLGLAAFDAILPDWYPKYTPAQPQMGYNPDLYGTGSQAIAEYGGYIKDDGNTPSAQAGGQATRQDSLKLYRRAMEIEKYYNSKNYKKQDEFKVKNNIFSNLAGVRENMENKLLDRNYPVTSRSVQQGEWNDKNFTIDDFYKKVDNNQFTQREAYDGILDLNSPAPLYDRRINPQYLKVYNNIDPGSGLFSDSVKIYEYDPVAVKPWDMLSPKEKEIRIQRYGEPQQELPNLKSSRVRGTDMTTTSRISPSGKLSDLSQKPTKYSVTVRDENAPGKQRSIYFKDKKAWRDFMDAGAISPISSEEREDSATAAGYRAMQEGGVLDNRSREHGILNLYLPKDTVKSIHLDDKRKINPATGKPFKNKSAKTIDAPQAIIQKIIAHAKAQGVDPYDALAVAMQESELGTTDDNLGHVRSKEYIEPNWETFKQMRNEDIEPYLLSIALKDKNTYAKTLARKGVIPATDAYRLQTYNGLGVLTPDTEKEYHKGTSRAFYEIPVSAKQPLDLKKNPAYGKTVLSLRDEILRNNQDIRNMVDTVQPYVQQPKMKDGGWIQKAINPKHKGYCTPMTKKTCTPRRKALAKTLKKMARKRKGAEGMIIPDNMSNFYPKRYEQGGNVNGGADIRMVGASYPNSDLLEQWLLYKQGGSVNGDAIINDVNAVYPNADLMEQWLLYKDGGQVNWTGKEFREVPARYPNTDLLEQWIQYKEGGQVNWNGREFREVGPRYPNTDLFEQWLQYQQGGPINNTGYLDGSATANNPYNIIPGGNITMQGVSQPIMARPIQKGSLGEEMMMMPGQDYNFNADGVMEYPMARAGLSAAKAKEMLRDGTASGKKLTKKQKQYFGMVAAGKAQMGTQVNNTAPGAPQLSAQEKYYQASARLGHFKNILNDKLKAKNPQGFKDYFTGLTGLRRTGDMAGAEKYVQDTPFDDYLTPAEVQSTLNPEDYNEYVGALQDVNSYNVQQGRQPLYGTKEGENDVRNLNYGRRFASLQLTPSVGVSNTEGTKSYGREYKYDPKTRQVSFSERGDLAMRPSYLSAPTPPIAGATASLKKGGVIYDDGGQIGTMWGGNSKLASYNPYDGGTVEFQGASHDNGGIGMHYNGTPVEVEGGEYAAQDTEGNLNIFGNMYLPGTRTKFKTVAKEIAKKEQHYDRLKTSGSKYVNEANPSNKFEKLKFNSGMVMMQGGELGQRDLAQKKESLSALQKAMLDTADEFGLDAEKLSAGRMAKAKKGKKVKGKGYYQAGGAINDPTMADRNNNPGNIKWGKFAKKMGAIKGPPADDGGNFAVFPNKEAGDKAMRTLLKSSEYKNLPIDKAIHKWTGKHPYKYDLSALSNAKVGDLSPAEFELMVGTMKQGEGTRYGPGAKTPSVAPPFTPYDLPNVPGFTPGAQRPRPGTVEPPYDPLNPPDDVNLPSNVEPLHINQLLGEIYAAATNSVEPVPTQRYEPQLYQPYQVSFQDRLNANQNSFNALRRAVGAQNPSSLGELAAQKYAADTNVKGEEFRTNQAIASDVTNKNVALLNDANLKNLALADTQMVRQSQARSNTRATNQMIVNSLSSKYMQNRYENKRLAAYENLYDYRFVPQEDGGLKATYFGPNALFNFSGNRAANQTPDLRTVTRYDAQGNVKGYTEYDDFDLREMQRALDLEMKRRNLPLMTVPPLNKK